MMTTTTTDSNNLRSFHPLTPLFISLCLLLTGCATSPNETAVVQTPTTQVLTASNNTELGDKKCLADEKRTVMDKKNVGPIAASLQNKIIAGTLTSEQMACELGKPHGIKRTLFEIKLHEMPMKADGRFLSWGKHHTNDPTDEVSVMAVEEPNGDVLAMVIYEPKNKKMKRVTKIDDKISVMAGTYSATVTYQ